MPILLTGEENRVLITTIIEIQLKWLGVKPYQEVDGKNGKS